MAQMQDKTSRRVALKALTTAAAVIALPQAQAIRPSSDSVQEADLWLRGWQQAGASHKELKGPLDLRRFRDPMYVLLSPIQWKSTAPSAILPVTAPHGFVTDFASIPRVFWSLFRPDGNYAYAATLHDYLYWEQDRPRSVADEVFRSAMSDLRISDRQAEILYHAVDLFGAGAWARNEKLKQLGEKRILAKLPDDPQMTWADWKLRPGIFAR